MTKCIARAGAAMRVNGVLTWLMVDQVGSTSVTSDINGALGDTVKYSAFGEVRAGGTATDYLYTSQRNEAEIGLDYYVARFYDPVIGHFIQADTIVQADNSFLPPLVVSYSNLQFLEKSNQENRVQNANLYHRSPAVPTNPLVIDRYAYVLNAPINNNDPSGYCVWDLCIIEGTVVGIVVIAGVPVEITVGMVVLAGAAAYMMVDAATPGFEDRMQGRAAFVSNFIEQVESGIKSYFARGEYVPPGMSERERRAYREAVHRYKDIHNIPANKDVDKKILNDLAGNIKKGNKPSDAAENADEPTNPRDNIRIWK